MSISSKVDQFLKESGGNNFTETAPRPPVPGEENETKSNGGMSTQSSGSHKSQVSHASSRSHCSKQGDTNPATPRKSNLDKTISCSVEGCEELEAPLGFEPEGSAANSPPFTENSTPPYLKWAENMSYLLDDGDGIELFRAFLDQEGAGRHSLEFWLACKGLKNKDQIDTEASQVIKVIQKKFIKSDKLPYLKARTKHAIYEKLKSGLDLTIFDVAQGEVEVFMRNNLYPLFIKSDLYIQYVQKGGDSPKSSNSSSGSNSARPLSGPLPPLVEDIELQQVDINSSFSLGPPVSKSRSRSHSSEKKHPDYFNFSAPYPPYQQRPVPYHVSYAPTSAQDSEIQSLSSQDNLTDDTISLTDSSVDGRSFVESKKYRKYYRHLQRKAGQNPDLGMFIPRTDRMDRAPKDRNIAEVDPAKFAQMLIERLEVVLKEQEKKEKFHVTLNKVDQSEFNDTMDRSCISTSSRNTTSIVPLLTSSMIDDENADSILDEHCSRVWDRSVQETPSPGRHSPPPRPKSPDRTRKVLSQTQPHSGSASMPSTLHSSMKPLHSKKKTDFFSMSSFDSGVVEDKCALETHKHIHHHHHHHHSRDSRKSKHKLEIEAQQHSYVCLGDIGTPRPHSSSSTGRKTNIRNHSSDAASNIDSGISLDSAQPHPPTFDTSNTKVLKWMMDNENVNRGISSTYPDSDKTRSSTDNRDNRRSHKAAALPPQVPQQQFKQSASKKGNGNRSASADSSYRQGWGPQTESQGASVLPSQPFVQDPSMPPLPLPDTTVRLQEVNRRLELADHSKTAPVKSKSFTGVPGKEKRVGMQMSQSSNQMFPPSMPATRTVPAELDLSSETRSEKKTSKRSSGSGNTSTSSRPDETVIGYFLCGEPIPYRTTIPQPYVTLGKLKETIGKKGNFRYFFKTHTNNNDFESDVVWEEITNDNCVLPFYEGKVVAKVDKID